jgi:hypothetical protein
MRWAAGGRRLLSGAEVAERLARPRRSRRDEVGPEDGSRGGSGVRDHPSDGFHSGKPWPSALTRADTCEIGPLGRNPPLQAEPHNQPDLRKQGRKEYAPRGSNPEPAD